MIPHLLLTLAGLAVLLVGGDLLVRGAVALARILKTPALLISLTIIAFGTSAPELFVAVTSVLENEPGIAVGNILGSTIANVLVVLGLPAIIHPISAQGPGLGRHGVALVAAAAAFAIVAYGFGALGGATGAALLAGILLYAVFLFATARASMRDPLVDDVEEFSAGAPNAGAASLCLIAGLIGLPVGAHLLIGNAAALAAGAGVSSEIVGLTVIAIGTSLPELATVIAAALHKRSDVAIGNVVGSNIFNLLAVGGAAGLAGGAAFDPLTLRLTIPAMLAATVVLAAFIFLRRDIGRLSGLLFGAAYGAFLVAAVMEQAPR